MPHILVVEDYVPMREIIQEGLSEQVGWTTYGVGDGQEALTYLEGTRPDAIVSDYNMPRMNGIQLLERIKDDPKLAGIPFILMSSDDELGHGRAENAGAKAFLQKPFPITDLREIITRFLEK